MTGRGVTSDRPTYGDRPRRDDDRPSTARTGRATA